MDEIKQVKQIQDAISECFDGISKHLIGQTPPDLDATRETVKKVLTEFCNELIDKDMLIPLTCEIDREKSNDHQMVMNISGPDYIMKRVLEQQLIDEAFREMMTDKETKEWFDSRPVPIQEAVKQRPTNLLYRLKETDQIVYIVAYGESEFQEVDVTARIQVTREFNFIISESEVFGISLDSLIPLCSHKDADKYRKKWSPKEEQVLNTLEEEFNNELDEIQKKIPKDIVGPERAKLVFAELNKNSQESQ